MPPEPADMPRDELQIQLEVYKETILLRGFENDSTWVRTVSADAIANVFTCPGIEDAHGTLRVTGTGTAGKFGLNTGGDGTGLFGNQPQDAVQDYMDALLTDGYLVVEVGWTFPGVWERPGTTTMLACRSATVIDWVANNLSEDNDQDDSLLGWQGNSGGSAQLAFALAYHGVDVIDLVHLSGGPPPCPIATAGLINFLEQPLCVVGGDLFDATREPLLFVDPGVHYPNTTVRFFIWKTNPTTISPIQPPLTMT